MGCGAHPNQNHPIQAARYNVDLGLHYLKQNQISRSKSKLLKAKQLDPSLPEAHSVYGLLLETVGELQEAKRSYLKAIRLNPYKGEAHHYYGVFLCRQQQYEVAEKELLKAIADPNYIQIAEVYQNMGDCLIASNKPEKAKTYWEKAEKHANRSEKQATP